MANDNNSLTRWSNATMIAPAQEQAIVGALKGYAKRIASLIGDQNVDVNQLMASVVLAVAKNDYLLACDPTSLILAVLQGAREGITSYSGPYAGGYLVPFGGKVTLIHNYKFLLDVALESGAIQGMSWGVVRENDTFDYQDGTKPFLNYKKLLKGERGDLINTWAVVTLPSGSQRIDVLEFDYLNRIREDSLSKIKDNAKQYSPWTQWPDEMAIKTQIRHALKTCGLNFDRHQRLVNLMENDDRAMVGQVAKEFEGLLPESAQPKVTSSSAASSLKNMAARNNAGPEIVERDDSDPSPLADLKVDLARADSAGAVDAIQKAWLKRSEEGLHGEIKSLCKERAKAFWDQPA